MELEQQHKADTPACHHRPRQQHLRVLHEQAAEHKNESMPHHVATNTQGMQQGDPFQESLRCARNDTASAAGLCQCTPKHARDQKGTAALWQSTTSNTHTTCMSSGGACWLHPPVCRLRQSQAPTTCKVTTCQIQVDEELQTHSTVASSSTHTQRLQASCNASKKGSRKADQCSEPADPQGVGSQLVCCSSSNGSSCCAS